MNIPSNLWWDFQISCGFSSNGGFPQDLTPLFKLQRVLEREAREFKEVKAHIGTIFCDV